MKQKLIIDTDPGIDDAMAIHYAFAHAGLDVLGLTTIFGNVFAWQAARNALLLSEQAHYPLDVIEGVLPPDPAFEPAVTSCAWQRRVWRSAGTDAAGNASGQNHRCVSV